MRTFSNTNKLAFTALTLAILSGCNSSSDDDNYSPEPTPAPQPAPEPQPEPPVPFAFDDDTYDVLEGLQGSVTLGLPTNTYLNAPYDFTMTYNNAGDVIMHGLEWEFKQMQQVDITENTCTDTIHPQEQCVIKGTFEADTYGDFTYEVTTRKDDTAETLHLSTSTRITDLPVTGKTDVALPSVGALNTPYATQVEFFNAGNRDLDGLVIDVVPDERMEVIESDAHKCTHLSVGESCIVNVTAQAIDQGPAQLAVRAQYAEGADVVVNQIMKATDDGIVVMPEVTLPENMGIGKPYELRMRYENVGDQQMNDLYAVTSASSNVNYVQKENTCGVTLEAGESCYISGEIVPKSEGKVTVEVLAQHDQGYSHVEGIESWASPYVKVAQEDFKHIYRPNHHLDFIMPYMYENLVNPDLKYGLDFGFQLLSEQNGDNVLSEVRDITFDNGERDGMSEVVVNVEGKEIKVLISKVFSTSEIYGYYKQFNNAGIDSTAHMTRSLPYLKVRIDENEWDKLPDGATYEVPMVFQAKQWQESKGYSFVIDASFIIDKTGRDHS